MAVIIDHISEQRVSFLIFFLVHHKIGVIALDTVNHRFDAGYSLHRISRVHAVTDPAFFCPITLYHQVYHVPLSNKLNDTTGLDDLLLGQLADVAGTDNKRHLGQTALAKQLSVAQGGEVDDGGGLGGLAQVLLAGLGGDERPQLEGKKRRAAVSMQNRLSPSLQV